MGAREGMVVGSSLLAFCVVVSDVSRAMERVQPGASTTSSSGPALPHFLDDERLPALQEAWQAREHAPEAVAPQPPQSVVAPMKAPTAKEPAAAPDDTASVRQRAEELSRRFSAEGASSKPAGNAAAPSGTMSPAAVPQGPSDRDDQVHAKPELPTRKKSETKTITTGAVTSAEVQPLDASVRTQSAMTTERFRLAAPPPPPEGIPPVPKRAPTATKAVSARTRSIRSYTSRQKSPDPKAALRGTILPGELRAFGWNNQPK